MFPSLIQINGLVPEAGSIAENPANPTAGKNRGAEESLFAQLLVVLCMPLAPLTELPGEPEPSGGEEIKSGGEVMPAAVATGELNADPEIQVSPGDNGRLMMLPAAETVPDHLPMTALAPVPEIRILPPAPENFSDQAETAVVEVDANVQERPWPFDLETISSPLPDFPRNRAGQPPTVTAGLLLKTDSLKVNNQPIMSSESVTRSQTYEATKVRFSVRNENPISAPSVTSRPLMEVMPVAPHPGGHEIFRAESITPTAAPEHPIAALHREANDIPDLPAGPSTQAVSGTGHILVPGSVTEKPEMPLRESAAISSWSEPVPISDLPKVLSTLTVAAADTGENRALLRLHPDHLGEVRAEITLRDGGCHVRLLPVLPVAHEALSTQADTLREALTRQGMLAVTVEVCREGIGGDRGTGGQRKGWAEETRARPQPVGGVESVRPNRVPAASPRFAASRGGLDVKV